MTLRDVYIAMSKINARLNDEFYLNAKLHGAQVKDRPMTQQDEKEFSREQERIASLAMKAAIERKKKARNG